MADYVDAGGGSHIVEVDFINWEGSSKQWGDTSETAGSPANGTDEDPLTQMNVLHNYMKYGRFDSLFNNASLSFGKYSSSSSSPWPDKLDVAIESPLTAHDVQEDGATIVDGSVTFVEIQPLDEAIDAVASLEY